MNSLVLDKSIALIDQSILDNICDHSNPLKVGKKGSFVRKDDTICEYYVIDTLLQAHGDDLIHQRFNYMMQIARQKEYNYLVIIEK